MHDILDGLLILVEINCLLLFLDSNEYFAQACAPQAITSPGEHSILWCQFVCVGEPNFSDLKVRLM